MHIKIKLFETTLYNAMYLFLLYVANIPSIPIVGRRIKGTGEKTFKANSKSELFNIFANCGEKKIKKRKTELQVCKIQL